MFSLAIVWIVFACVQDIKKREIANWLNFSLIIFALGFRLFYSIFEGGDMNFFYQGVLGLGVFFALGNIFYYGRMFAGGDSKLMVALGPVLPIYGSFNSNLKLFLLFVILFLISGALYGVLVTLVSGILNFKKLKKEYLKQFRVRKGIVYGSFMVSVLIFLFGFYDRYFFGLGAIMFVLVNFYLYVKSVDEACMVRKVKVEDLTVGDWLYKDVKVGKRVVLSNWEGLSEEDLKILKGKKYVWVRYGVQFAPVFLISFILWMVNVLFGFNFFNFFS